MRKSAEAALVLSAGLGSVARRARSETRLGWADVTAGDLDGVSARMLQHLSERTATGSRTFSDHCPAPICRRSPAR